MSKPNPFKGFRSSPEIIRLAVMMYVRFPLSLRNVEDLLHERGIDVCHETVRFWWQRFCPSALYSTLWSIERYLARWASGKYKTLRGRKRRSLHWLLRIAQRQPRLFAHWPLLHGCG